MKRIHLLIIGILTSLVLVVACSKELGNDSYSLDFRQITMDAGGQFRGLSLGDPIFKCYQYEEQDNLVGGDHRYQYFQVDLNDAEFFDINYFTENEVIYEMQSDFYLEEDWKALDLLEEFSRYYDHEFGQHILDENGNRVWNARHPKEGTRTVIVLKDVINYLEEKQVLELDRKLVIRIMEMPE